MVPPPTDEQILLIAKRIAVLKSQDFTKIRVKSIVIETCPNARYLIQEGVDNSEINTALLVAIQAAAKQLANRA